jgi:hypothetical protein
MMVAARINRSSSSSSASLSPAVRSRRSRRLESIRCTDPERLCIACEPDITYKRGEARGIENWHRLPPLIAETSTLLRLMDSHPL